MEAPMVVDETSRQRCRGQSTRGVELPVYTNRGSLGPRGVCSSRRINKKRVHYQCPLFPLFHEPHLGVPSPCTGLLEGSKVIKYILCV